VAEVWAEAAAADTHNHSVEMFDGSAARRIHPGEVSAVAETANLRDPAESFGAAELDMSSAWAGRHTVVGGWGGTDVAVSIDTSDGCPEAVRNQYERSEAAMSQPDSGQYR
jgi:hypothetical protein